MKPRKPLTLDGRTGEGGGQLVRVAIALASVTSQPLRIQHVRGNRAGPKRGGGLKAQHVSSIRWLAEATQAEVVGLEVGSHELEFRPTVGPAEWTGSRKVTIETDSPAASALLILQAVLPFLVFAATGEGGTPIELVIEGGTNVSWSLSYEYADQVLLPSLEENFGVVIERRLEKRGWSSGPLVKGRICLKVHSVPRGQTLRSKGRAWDRKVTKEDLEIEHIDVSIIAPSALHEELQRAVVRDLETLFPDVDVVFKIVEDSGHDARMYILLVAHSKTGLRWGRDLLYSAPRKKKRAEELSSEISCKVSKDLFREIQAQGVVDEFLQDQLVVFQALAEGRTGFHRGARDSTHGLEDDAVDPDDNDEASDPDSEVNLQGAMANLQLGPDADMKPDKRIDEPFGEGSLHTTTARWVTTQLLPQVKWFNKGTVCDGIGMSFS